jgi:hypothetical protein
VAKDSKQPGGSKYFRLEVVEDDDHDGDYGGSWRDTFNRHKHKTMASIARPLLRSAQPTRMAMRTAARTAPLRQAIAGPSRILPLIQQRRFKSTETTGAEKPASSAETAAPAHPAIEAPVPGQKPQPIGKIEPRL